MPRALTIAPLALLFWMIAGASPLRAAPIAVDDVPEGLRPWIRWVLHDLPQARCPYLLGSTSERRCLWPSRLSLVIGEERGEFVQRWQVHERSWVALPGDAERWPQEVAIDGEPAVVVPRGGVPGVELAEGIHELRGVFLWDAMPERLRVPPETGLLDLTVREGEGPEKVIAAPQREADGVVWLHRRAEEGTQANRLDIVVNRRIADTIPIVVTTQVELQVSGKNREVLLGRALLTGFQPMAVESELPARLEPDGALRVQVRPGRWTINVDARYERPITALPLEANTGPWSEEEIWVFEAHNELRRVEISEVVAIDPQQTRLPDAWRSLPAYRIRPGETMLMVESHRGEVDRGPDRLRLNREWWLDFDGKGLTFRDYISGELHHGSRLTLSPPATLGRVAAGGKDQFITQIGDPSHPGIEIRQRSLDVQAEGRVPMARELSAVDWEHDFHEVGGALNLPPGWRLLHVAGVDDVGDSWIERWDLLEIFLVLVIAIGIARLYGPIWGLFALFTLVAAFPEWMAPRTVWLFVMVGEGLLRVLPEGKLRRVTRLYRLASLVMLAGIVVGFSVQQIRGGLYPALEKTYDDNLGSVLFLGARSYEPAVVQMAPPAPPMAAPMEPAADAWDGAPMEQLAAGEKAAEIVDQEEAWGGLEADEDAGGSGQRHKGEEGYMGKPTASSRSSFGRSKLGSISGKKRLQEYDASTVIQTGPGVPSWSWRRVELSWSGPVDRGQRIRLFLLNPAANLGLAVIRVLFMTLLTLVVFGVFGGRRRPKSGGSGGGAGASETAGKVAAAAAVLLALGTAFAPREAKADEAPRAELLDQLRDRLVEAPTCLPECAAIPRLRLAASADALRMVIEVHAASDIALPLPGNAAQWLPSSVLVDDQGPGDAGRGLARQSDGTLWIDLPAGRHQVVVEGPLPARETVQIAFPLRPRRVEAVAKAWTIDGLHEDGLADADLQLTRIHSEERVDSLEMGPLPPFVRIERELNLGLTWEVTTRVVRLTPPGSAVVVAVPLLKGESVTTADLRVEGGNVQVNMAPDASIFEWSSALEEQPLLELRAAEGQPWVELWRVQAGPVWHVGADGIPVIRQGDGGLREWQPWPGEAVTFTVSRPTGVEGQTLTIDNANLELRPGLRATDATLSVQIRSSRGGQHDFVLPPEAQLQSVTINGIEQTIGQTGAQVRVPVVPGAQNVVLTWREPMTLASRYDGPAVGLGAAAVNVSVRVDFPRDRWILWVAGPRLGPAVLFWSYIAMLILASLVLGQIRWTPLRHHQWFLLGLGLSPLPVPAAMLVVGWVLALGWRRRHPNLSAGWFNLRQLVLAGWTLAAMGALIGAITAGLLGQPDMQIEGNGSYRWTLQWFQDRSNGGVPRPWVLAVSMWWYRGAMLAWALWLAWSLIRWLPWAWQSFSGGGYWKKMIPDHWMHRGAAEGGSMSAAPPAASQSRAWEVPPEAQGDNPPGWAGMPTPEVGVRPIGAPAPASTPEGAPPRTRTMMGSDATTPRPKRPASAPQRAAGPSAGSPAPGEQPPPWRRLPPKGTVIPPRISTRAGDDDGEGDA
ncbi:MAG: hypothetical protein H6711_02895 [Myxococcales bacterium]|nr:hypothetical protein [Myxococcales bacterium]